MWNPRDDLVEKIPRPPTVQGRHRVGLTEAERHEFPAFLFAPFVVGLVGHQQHLDPAAAQPRRDQLVFVGDTDRRIDHEDHASRTASST